MQITGMLWGRKLLDLVEFPHSEVRGPELSVDDIKDMIKRHGQVFIKPVWVKKANPVFWAEWIILLMP